MLQRHTDLADGGVNCVSDGILDWPLTANVQLYSETAFSIHWCHLLVKQLEDALLTLPQQPRNMSIAGHMAMRYLECRKPGISQTNK